VLISSALLHNPDILVFDEPLSGLDVTTGLVFRNLIKSLAREGKIILYSSHVLEVVEKVCTHVMILRKGRVAANDTVENLRNLMDLGSLEDIFSELVLDHDVESTANSIVDVMKA
jgi:ABC-2 type transport system ATP-binding protein